MLMFIWFWAATAALFPTPARMIEHQTQSLEAITHVAVQVTRPLMALGWVDDDEAPIF